MDLNRDYSEVNFLRYFICDVLKSCHVFGCLYSKAVRVLSTITLLAYFFLSCTNIIFIYLVSSFINCGAILMCIDIQNTKKIYRIAFIVF